MEIERIFNRFTMTMLMMMLMLSLFASLLIMVMVGKDMDDKHNNSIEDKHNYIYFDDFEDGHYEEWVSSDWYNNRKDITLEEDKYMLYYGRFFNYSETDFNISVDEFGKCYTVMGNVPYDLVVLNYDESKILELCTDLLNHGEIN